MHKTQFNQEKIANIANCTKNWLILFKSVKVIKDKEMLRNGPHSWRLSRADKCMAFGKSIMEKDHRVNRVSQRKSADLLFAIIIITMLIY